MIPAKTLQADRYPRKRMNGPHLEESVNVCCGLWMASCLVGPAASMSRSSPEKHWTLDTTCSYHVCSVTTASASQTVSSVLAARARAQCRRGGQSVLCRGSTPPPHPIRLRRSREPLQGKHLAVHWGEGETATPRLDGDPQFRQLRDRRPRGLVRDGAWPSSFDLDQSIHGNLWP